MELAKFIDRLRWRSVGVSAALGSTALILITPLVSSCGTDSSPHCEFKSVNVDAGDTISGFAIAGGNGNLQPDQITSIEGLIRAVNGLGENADIQLNTDLSVPVAGSCHFS